MQLIATPHDLAIVARVLKKFEDKEGNADWKAKNADQFHFLDFCNRYESYVGQLTEDTRLRACALTQSATATTSGGETVSANVCMSLLPVDSFTPVRFSQVFEWNSDGKKHEPRAVWCYGWEFSSTSSLIMRVKGEELPLVRYPTQDGLVWAMLVEPDREFAEGTELAQFASWVTSGAQRTVLDDQRVVLPVSEFDVSAEIDWIKGLSGPVEIESFTQRSTTTFYFRGSHFKEVHPNSLVPSQFSVVLWQTPMGQDMPVGVRHLHSDDYVRITP